MSGKPHRKTRGQGGSKQAHAIAAIIFFALCVCIVPLSHATEDQIELGSAPVFPEFDQSMAAQAIPQSDRVLLSIGLTVDPTDREQSRNFYYDYYDQSVPSIAWTGNASTCAAGTTTDDFKDAIATRINYFRAMAGVPADIMMVGEYSAKSQEAALMMSAQGALSHTPPISWACYSEDGAEAAGSSNLALGMYGVGAIAGYMQDPGTSNAAAGHRRWILYPQTEDMGTGDVPSGTQAASNSLWVFDDNMWGTRPAVRDGFVAWPPPGYVPYQVTYARWSFAYPGADFSGATVTMTKNGQGVPVALEPYSSGYGENTLVWRVNNMGTGDSWPQPADDTDYSVSVSNVMISGQSQNFNYTVTVFDPGFAVTAPAPQPPAKATLLAPSGTIASAAPTFQWNKVDGSTWYYLWVNNASGAIIKKWYTAAQVDQGSLCSVVSPNTLASGPYTWWIQTWNSYGYGPWSAAMSFTVGVAAPPGVATLVSPSGAISNATPDFTWNPVSGSTWYYLWVNNASGAIIKKWYTAAQVAQGSVCSVISPISLASGNYTWWVQTWNSYGYGPWSAAMSFMVGSDTPPGRATLVSPSGVITNATPNFTWNPVSGSTWYYLWVNNASGAIIKKWYTAAQVAQGSVCSAISPSTLANGTYTWWIQTWNSNGYGPWSAAMSFTVQ